MKIFALFFILVMSITVCLSQEITNVKKDALIENIKVKISQNFVSTDYAQLISDSLNSREFLEITDRSEFIKALNKKLFYYTHDKHLSVEYNPDYAKELNNGKDDKLQQLLKEKKENYGFEAPKILPGNIGYLKLNYFADTKNARQAALKSIALIRETKALILDLRNNSGGSGSMVQLLSSIFLPDPEEPILNIFYKSGDTVSLKTQEIDSMDKYHSKPLFILIDKNTFSAAEAFTFILKNRKRATVIGSNTAGAGNIAGPYPLGSDYIITIPVGKIVDPLTKTGWEGTGVQPNIETGSEDPLEVAKSLADS